MTTSLKEQNLHSQVVTPVTGSPAMRGVINKQLAENSFGKYIEHLLN